MNCRASSGWSVAWKPSRTGPAVGPLKNKKQNKNRSPKGLSIPVRSNLPVHFVGCKIKHRPSTGVIPHPSILSGKEHQAPSRECARDHRPCLALWKQAAVALRRGGGGGGKLAFVSRATSVEAGVKVGAEERGSQGWPALFERLHPNLFPFHVSSRNKNNFFPKQTNKQTPNGDR